MGQKWRGQVAQRLDHLIADGLQEMGIVKRRSAVDFAQRAGLAFWIEDTPAVERRARNMAINANILCTRGIGDSDRQNHKRGDGQKTGKHGGYLISNLHGR